MSAMMFLINRVLLAGLHASREALLFLAPETFFAHDGAAQHFMGETENNGECFFYVLLRCPKYE